MKGKKIIAIFTVVGILSIMGIAYAAVAKTPAEIVSELTGKTTEELYAQKQEGKTYGTIAKENEVLDEFKAQMMEQKKSILDQRVADGKMTQEQATEIYDNMKERQATCDGTASGNGNSGAGFGCGNGGKGRNCGGGQGMGAGRGGNR